MGQESRAEKVACEALDLEGDADWTGAADKWEAAAKASSSRKKEYSARAATCREQAAKAKPKVVELPVVPTIPDLPAPAEDEPHLEHLERANDLEADGHLERAAAEWELAAGKVAGADREVFLQRAEQLRVLVRGDEPKVEIAVTLPDAPAKVPTVRASGVLPVSIEVLDPVEEADVPGPEVVQGGDPPELTDARDPRLPPVGSKLRRDFPNRTWVEVEFGEGTKVKVTGADKRHSDFVGREFATPSSLGREWRTKNTNGYEWLGLAPKNHGAPATTAMGLRELARTAVQARGLIVEGSNAEVNRHAIALAARSIASVLSELADVLEEE